MKTILYPGSFDPVTNGHIDVIERASKLFDKIIVCIAINGDKNSMFSMKQRLDFLEQVTQHITNIEIKTFNGLLINAVKEFDACAVVRGLRAVSDFEYEFQMALMNRELDKNCETIFMMPKTSYSFLSSKLIKEIAYNNGDVSPFVPRIVVNALKKATSN